jgi:hypothetical protein
MLWMILTLSGMFPIRSDAVSRPPAHWRQLRSLEKTPFECRMPLSNAQPFRLQYVSLPPGMSFDMEAVVFPHLGQAGGGRPVHAKLVSPKAARR